MFVLFVIVWQLRKIAGQSHLLGKRITKYCKLIDFPNHPQKPPRKECSNSLMKSVVTCSERNIIHLFISILTEVLSQVWKNYFPALNLENFYSKNPIGVLDECLAFVMVVCGKNYEIQRTNKNSYQRRDTYE